MTNNNNFAVDGALQVHELLALIRTDVLAWPGGRSIHDDHEADAFAPTTLAMLMNRETLAGDPEVQLLVARAQGSEWSAADAHALVARVAQLMGRVATEQAAEAYVALDGALRRPRVSEANRARGHEKYHSVWLAEYDRQLERGTPQRFAAATAAKAWTTRNPQLHLSDKNVAETIRCLVGKRG